MAFDIEILQIKHLQQGLEDVESVELTPDLKLLSVKKTNNNLLTASMKASINCDCLTILDVKSFSWLEDNYHENQYRLLVVNLQNEISHYEIKISELGQPFLMSVSKWKLKLIFQYFQELSKALETVTSMDILKFEAREAVFLLNNRIIVSLFPSSSEPQVLSFADISEDNRSFRKVLLLKEMLFALNDVGTVLSIYSFANNTKLWELALGENNPKLKETGSVINFLVSLKLDRILFITENQKMYFISIEMEEFEPKLVKDQTLESNTVTAFSKQFPSVKRLGENTRRYSTTSGFIQLINFPRVEKDFILKDVCLFENKLCFLLGASEGSILGIHLLDTHAECPTASHKTHANTHLVRSGCEEVPFPLLLLCGNELSMLLCGIGQERLVNELMVYPSGGAVERLALLNNWMNIQMDIQVLRLGLRNRQLYTVEFYLKTLLEEFSQQWSQAGSRKWIEKVKKECELWQKILDLLFETVCRNLTDLASYQFAEQLLQVSISVLTQILFVVNSKSAEEERGNILEQQKNTLNLFSALLLKMRKLLNQHAPMVRREEGEGVPNSTETLCLWAKWESCHWEEVVRQSLVSGDVGVAQTFLSQGQEARGSYAQVEATCLHFVLDYLRQALMPEALTLLTNMGIEIGTKLKDILYSTSEKDVRSAIVTELRRRSLLTRQDEELLHFVSMLQNLYPCSSFDHARQLLDDKQCVFNRAAYASAATADVLAVGDFMPFHQDNSESGFYCRIVLQWVEAWDDETKGRIIAPHIIKQSPTLEFFKREESIAVSPLSMWLHVLQNGNLTSIVEWLHSWLRENQPLWNFPLNEDMVNIIAEVAPFHVTQLALNELGRHGVFCEDELEEFSSFLKRTGHSSCNINDVSVFSSDIASLSFYELWHRTSHYCLKHKLYKVLYSFMSKNYYRFTAWPVCHLCNISLLKMMKVYCLWSRNLDDTNLANDVIATNAQYVYNMQHFSPEQIITNVPAPLNIAILLFGNTSLSEVMNQSKGLPSEQKQAVAETFNVYPLLSEFVLGNEEQRKKWGVTVYELLKGNSAFDTTLLFGWQSCNALKSEDARGEVPHFSLSSLSQQFGLRAELTHLYHLAAERPHRSHLGFLVQELTSSRIKSVCEEVRIFALSQCRNVSVGAASVCFMEALGEDSLPLRLCLVAATLLQGKDAQHEESPSQFARIMQQAQGKKESAVVAVSALENMAFSKWIASQEKSSPLFADIVLWMPVMSLASLFGVECGMCYLVECAKENKWLEFLVFSEVFQLPKEQVLRAAMKFSDVCITYHLFNALQKSGVPAKDIRRSWLSHIGLTHEAVKDIGKAAEVADDEKMSICSGETSSSSSDIDIASLLPKDLFGLLLSSHRTSTQWASHRLLQTACDTRNPALALLAALQPDCDLISCFFTWLYANLCHNENLGKQLKKKFHPDDSLPRTEEDLVDIILLAIYNSKILVLWQGVKFFVPDTPLLPLMDSLKHFFVHRKFDSSIECFQNKLWDFSSAGHSGALHSLRWVEKVAVRVLEAAVVACTTHHEKKVLLRHYTLTRVEKSFSQDVSVPPFMKVCEMLQFLDRCEHAACVESFLHLERRDNYDATCWQVAKELLGLHLYEDASRFAKAAQLPPDQMLMLQVNCEADEVRGSEQWTRMTFRINFWRSVLKRIKQSNVPVSIVVTFLETQIEVSDRYGEKYFLGKFIVELLRTHLETQDLEMQKKKNWFWCIKAEVVGELSPEILDDIPQQMLDIYDICYNPTSSVSYKFDEKEREATGRIIRRFLSIKDLDKAFHLAMTFGYDCSEVKAISFCLQLAKEEVEPCLEDISGESAGNVSSLRIVKSLVTWITKEYAGLAVSQRERIECMEKVCQQTPAAASVCHQILVHYAISAILGVSYLSIVEEKDIFATLKNIVFCQLKDDHIVVKSLLVVHDVPDKEVVEFFSEKIWSSLKVLSTSSSEKVPVAAVLYDPSSSTKGFQMVMKTVQDHSLLGKRLMDIYSYETTDLSSRSAEATMKSVVALLACSHDCFSAACDVGGISRVLHLAHRLTHLLVEGNHFPVLIQLLTGIGRYSEMMYVFDTLKKHDKFHLLFEGKTEKEQNLRLALLDYLKRSPSSQVDGHYQQLGMDREKAEILEMAAQKRLARLCNKMPPLDSYLREELDNAMQDLASAAESYCEADCLHQAQMCAELAELVALQIHLLPSGVWIIGLDEVSVARFITEHSIFSQAAIVAQAYRHPQSWNSALLQQVVLGEGHRHYLRDFQASISLSATSLIDIVKKFQQGGRSKEGQARGNMRRLLAMCPNVKVMLALARELAFEDMVAELLSGHDRSYLCDLHT